MTSWRQYYRRLTLGAVAVLTVAAIALSSSAWIRQLVWSLTPKPPARALATPPLEPARPSAGARAVRIPAADASGRVVVPVTDAVPRELPSEGVPFGWNVRQFSGHAGVDLIRADGRLALRLRADKAAFALFRDVVVDPTQTPYLAWSWRATRLPPAGDARQPGHDDQAIGVYVVFPRWPSPRTASDVLGYVWDTRAPIGTRVTSAHANNVRFLVVESGEAPEGWRSVERNVADDYVALFGRPAPRIGKVAVAADTDDTRGQSEAFVGDLIFSRAPSKGAENPRIMLR